MFGDDYKRGELLVNLNREHGAAGIDCGDELPDHLPNVLRLLARWEDRELAAEFAEEILHPALERMVAEFEPRPQRGTRRAVREALQDADRLVRRDAAPCSGRRCAR